MEEFGHMDFITLATSVEADTSFTFTATVIIAGLGIVLCTLALLVLVFKGFGALISKSQNKSKKAEKGAQPAPTATKKAAPTVTAAKDGVSEEIVAAISAAVYAMDGNNAVVTSVTPIATAPVIKRANPIKNRNPWAQAAVSANTKPF